MKKFRRIRNKSYRERKSDRQNEETRVLLRVINREVSREIAAHKSSYWQSFLSRIREKSDWPEKDFWSHLARIYKSKSLPFSSLDTGQSVTSNKKEIVDALFRTMKTSSKARKLKTDDPNDMELEEEPEILPNELNISKESIESTSAFEITKFIKDLKPKKSSAYDQISNFMIKLLPPS